MVANVFATYSLAMAQGTCGISPPWNFAISAPGGQVLQHS
jgi:hypothetical protein